MRKPRRSSFNLLQRVPCRVQLIYADDLLAINSDHQSVAPSQDPLQAKGPLAQLQGQNSRSVDLSLGRPAALFLRLSLPSTLIRHENEAFRKRSSNRRNLKTPAFRFRFGVGENILKTELFENNGVTIIM